MQRYVCSSCGYKSLKKYTICPKCHHAGTMAPEESERTDSKTVAPGAKVNPSKGHEKRTYTVSELKRDMGELERQQTGIDEFDRLLMGGIVDGQVILVGASPGFGKSTLCLEIEGNIAAKGKVVLYASGEESERQIAQRAERLGIDSDNLHIMPSKTVEDVLATADSLHADMLVVDSLQTMGSDDVSGTAGGQAQSKEAAYAFTDWAKRTDGKVLLISQFTKGDEVAGSNMIAHIVDTILIGDSDDDSPLKFLRSKKNRYGRTDEVAVFVHEEDGLKSVSDPSGYLIGDDSDPIQGAAMTFMQDGIRLLPVEINALVSASPYKNPQRQFFGMDGNRAKILVAALSKYVDMEDILSTNDAFASTINGIKLTDTMTDLAVVAALASSGLGKEPLVRTAWIGEVSLTGRVRGRSLMEGRIRECSRLGIPRAVVPQSALDSFKGALPTGVEVKGISSLSQIPRLL